MSIFGGPNDSGMVFAEGVACFEHKEADLRPDLFYPRATDPNEGASKRLKPHALYFAYRFPRHLNRNAIQSTVWMFINPKNGLKACASLVDFGPAEYTERTFDLSPYLAELLRLKTDDEVEGFQINT